MASCALNGSCISFRYLVPFQASIGQQTGNLIERMNLKGTAIDASVNQNNWRVPVPELKGIVDTLKGAQLRIDHSESIRDVIGKVNGAYQEDDKVQFEGESGDAQINDKIHRGYLNSVSIQVDSDNVKCSSCGAQTRYKNALIHAMHDGAWEDVYMPKARELSIVATPAYATTKFGVAAVINNEMLYNGFKAGLDGIITSSRQDYIDDLNAYVEIRAELIRRGIKI